MISDKIINLFCDINYYSNGTQQENCKEKSDEKLFDDIPVECFQFFIFFSAQIEQVLLINTDKNTCKNPFNLCSIFYKRCISFTTISFFHVVKVPSLILVRASVTSHK